MTYQVRDATEAKQIIENAEQTFYELGKKVGEVIASAVEVWNYVCDEFYKIVYETLKKSEKLKKERLLWKFIHNEKIIDLTLDKRSHMHRCRNAI